MTNSIGADLDLFESHRALLVAHAYRMLGDLGRAEDMVTDGGAEGRRVAGIRNLQAPLQGAARIAAFIVATARTMDLEAEMHEQAPALSGTAKRSIAWTAGRIAEQRRP